MSEFIEARRNGHIIRKWVKYATIAVNLLSAIGIINFVIQF